MAYTIDKQTHTDLNVTGRFRHNSIFSIFNDTQTKGASLLMEKVFSDPLTNASEINSRRDIFASLKDFDTKMPISGEQLSQVEEYLGSTDYASGIISLVAMYKTKILSLAIADQQYSHIVEGVALAAKLLAPLNSYLKQVKTHVSGTQLETKIVEAISLLEEAALSKFINSSAEGLSLSSLASKNRLLRYSYSDKLRKLFRLLEEVDFYTTVARVGKEKGFQYANALDGEQMFVDIKNVRHPRVPAAVGNDISMNHNSNVIFLTGANMAGKSTLMKSFGIAVYMAHLGFPMAIDKMEFTPLEGMFTSINVPDDISQGYSHFYAEVMRVKGVAQEVASGKRLMVIFDELFKGTNVKDAYDGTVAITRAFSRCHKCIFIISTHIMEAGLTLKQECDNLQFLYLPTQLSEDGRPKYTYKLTEGIADDRYGMRIINNEKIIEIIRGKK